MPNWQLVTLGILMIIAFSGLTVSTAIVHNWGIGEMLLSIFVPAFIARSVVAFLIVAVAPRLEKYLEKKRQSGD
jgi:hypothetical protein